MLKKISHSKPLVAEDDVEIVVNQILSGMHGGGDTVKEFENKLAEFIGTNYAKSCNSGTNALYLALLALDIGNGDEVIFPSYICLSVLNAVAYTQATPIPSDINSDFREKGCNISAETIKPLITDKTKAIVVAHMFGIPADMDDILALGIPVIEDCAHSLGASYKGKKLGSLGDLSIFSFYATKVISTGHGGMILTSSEKLKEKLDDLTTYDRRENYKTSYNYSLSAINAALGLSQLKKLPEFLEKRKQIAEAYNQAFQNLPIKLPPQAELIFRYIISLKNKQQQELLEKQLKQKGIMAEQPIFKPIHQYLNLDNNNYSNSELAHDTSLSIPIYPALTEDEIKYIIKTIQESFQVI